jgi:hypothetical protein
MIKGLIHLDKRNPVNKSAKRVICSGEHYNNTRKIGGTAHFKSPPPLIAVAPNQEDLTGYRFGYFTVIGRTAGTHSHIRKGRGLKRGSLWLVRCDCGDYELRYRKSILNLNNYGDRCAICRGEAQNKKAHIKRTQGIKAADRIDLRDL